MRDKIIVAACLITMLLMATLYYLVDQGVLSMLVPVIVSVAFILIILICGICVKIREWQESRRKKENPFDIDTYSW